MKSKLRVVLDTNILLVSIPKKSPHHWIFEKLIANEFDLFISNEVLMEYEEIISRRFDFSVARDIIKALLILPNVYKISIYYKQLVELNQS